MGEKILVTGAAGFIGAAIIKRLLKEDLQVIGIDNINSYYNPKLKLKRLEHIEEVDKNNSWEFHKEDLADKERINKIFKLNRPSIVINLAAQAGVRYSLLDPMSYIQSNIVGFLNILECCRNFKVKNFIYASSSSVYGGNKIAPYSEKHSVDHPISLYAATKKSNEVIAHSYSHLYKIPSTGLRFFTVYGPEGRPDMAPMIFSDSMLRGKPINVFNNGKMSRDFTYIDDVVDAIYKCCFKIPYPNNSFYAQNPEPSTSFAPHRIFNIGSNNPISLINFIEKLESALGVKAIKKMKGLQPGDVESTFADISRIQEWIDYSPNTSFENGINNFALWFKKYFESDYYVKPNLP